MNRLFFAFCLLPFFLSGQTAPLRVLEPKLAAAPDISAAAAENLARNQSLWERIDSLIATYPDEETARRHLSKAQLAFWDSHLDGLPEDHLQVGPMGCSWYCGGGPDTIFASSQLKPNGAFTYLPQNIHDFSLRTAWVEGVKGNGVGQSITFVFRKQSPPVTAVEIYNGYMKSEKAWRDNGRVKQLKLYVDGQPYALLNLKDELSLQRFELGRELQGVKKNLALRFEITAVYPGAKYEDVAIAELEFDGTGVHCFVAGTPILLANGKSKPIEQLQIGDQVLSLNTQTGKTEPACILELAQARHHNLYEYHFADGSIIIGTDDHPFFLSDGTAAALNLKAAGRYGAEQMLLPGMEVLYYTGIELTTRKLLSAHVVDGCLPTFTVLKLDKNRVFFAGGVGVGTEDVMNEK